MSQHTYYQAFPEHCGLFQRLLRDQAFHRLHAQLTLLGPGPFFLSQISPAEVGHVLDWFVEQAPASSQADATRLLHEVREEAERTAACHPGIEHRAAYFEQVQEEIAGVLAGELHRRGIPLAAALVHQVLYGQDVLAPGLFGGPELQWFLVPVGTVCKAADALFLIEPATLAELAGDLDLDAAAYERWQTVYVEAAGRGEVVAVLNA